MEKYTYDYEGYVPYERNKNTIVFETSDDDTYLGKFVVDSIDVFHIEDYLLLLFAYQFMFHVIEWIPILNMMTGIIRYCFNGFWIGSTISFMIILCKTINNGHNMRMKIDESHIYNPNISLVFEWKGQVIWNFKFLTYTPDMITGILNKVNKLEILEMNVYNIKNFIYLYSEYGQNKVMQYLYK